MQSTVIEFTQTQADTIAAYRRQSLDRFLSWPNFVTMAALSAAMFGAAISVLPPYYRSVSLLIPLWDALGGFGLPLVFLRVRIPAVARRVYRQSAGMRSAIIMSWSEAGLAAGTQTACSLTPWTHCFRWREDSQVVLLYLNEALFQFIPKRVLSAEQLASLRNLAASSGVPGART